MATCSYQALARYDDDCSRKYRARNLDDIRVTHREAVVRARLQLRCLQMLQNRQTLADILLADEHDDYHLSSPGYDEPDAAAATSSDTTWLEASVSASAWPEDEGSVSSVWSTESTSTDLWPSEYNQQNHNQHQVTCLSQVPESFLAASPPNSRRKQSRPTLMYKQTGSSPSSSSLKVPCNSAKTKQDLDNLMNLIQNCPPTIANISHLIENSWQTLLSAIQDPQTGKASMELLRSICNQNLLTPMTMVNLIQHGLNYSLYNALQTLDQAEGTIQVCDLLIAITSTQPAIIPYLVESMTSSKLLSELEERIIYGDYENTHAVINFYYQLSEIILAQRENPPQPLVPQVLINTGVSQRTIDSYGPNATMEKYLTPELLKCLVTRCLNRNYSKYGTSMNYPLELLANIVKLAYSSENEQWTVGTLSCLRDLEIVVKMKDIIKGLHRLAKAAESSEHCSQGVSFDDASTSARVCTQFLQFYEQYYNYLAQINGL